MVKRIEIDGSSVIGVFASCTEDVVVVPPSTTDETVTNLERELGCTIFKETNRLKFGHRILNCRKLKWVCSHFKCIERRNKAFKGD